MYRERKDYNVTNVRIDYEAAVAEKAKNGLDSDVPKDLLSFTLEFNNTYSLTLTLKQIFENDSFNESYKLKGCDNTFKLYYIKDIDAYIGFLLQIALRIKIVSAEEYMRYCINRLLYRINSSRYTDINQSIGFIFYRNYVPAQVQDKFKNEDSQTHIYCISEYEYSKTFENRKEFGSNGYALFCETGYRASADLFFKTDWLKIPEGLDVCNVVHFYEIGGKHVGYYTDDQDRVRPRTSRKEKVEKFCEWTVLVSAMLAEFGLCKEFGITPYKIDSLPYCESTDEISELMVRVSANLKKKFPH